MKIYSKIWSMLTVAERRAALILVTLMVAGALLETIGIGMVIPAIALLTQEEWLKGLPTFQQLPVFVQHASHPTLIVCGMLFLVAVYVVKTVFLGLLTWMQLGFAYRVQAEISQRLFSLYIYKPYVFHLQRNSAHLHRNIIEEVSLMTANAIVPGMLLLSEVLVVFCLCLLLLLIEPLGTLAVIAVLGGVVATYYFFTRGRIGIWGLERQKSDAYRVLHLQQGLHGIKDVKLLGREIYFLAKYDAHNLQSARMAKFQSFHQQFPRLLLEVLAVIALAILVIVMLMRGTPYLDIVPTLGLFAASAFRLMPSLNRILNALQSLRYTSPVVDMLHDELKSLRSRDQPRLDDNRQQMILKEHLTLERVSFTYEGANRPTISNVSICIKRGECVGFIGASGSGKSTLVDMILGLLPIDRGEIRVDNLSVADNLRGWQGQIGYVPQTIYLIDDSLKRNIAFGIPDDRIDEAALQNAIRDAQLSNYISKLPDGLDTVVGERGVRISGGQRQRIGIARALYNKPSILILDEATSALDLVTEGDVMRAIDALRGVKTIILVAHRLSTVERCDRIFEFGDGQIQKTGTPEEILAFKGSTNHA